VILNFEGEAESLDVDGLITQILEESPPPGRDAA